jgi:hypothetical protein
LYTTFSVKTVSGAISRTAFRPPISREIRRKLIRIKNQIRKWGYYRGTFRTITIKKSSECPMMQETARGNRAGTRGIGLRYRLIALGDLNTNT